MSRTVPSGEDAGYVVSDNSFTVVTVVAAELVHVNGPRATPVGVVISIEPSVGHQSLSTTTSAVPLIRANVHDSVDQLLGESAIEQSTFPEESVTVTACPPSPYESLTQSVYSVLTPSGGRESARPSPSVSVHALRSNGNGSAMS